MKKELRKWDMLNGQFDTNYILESNIGIFTTRKNFATGNVEMRKGSKLIGTTSNMDMAFAFVNEYICLEIADLEVATNWESVSDGWISNYSFCSFVIYKKDNLFTVYSGELNIEEKFETFDEADEFVLDQLRKIKES